MAVTFDIAASGFTVRPARPMDAAACRMLLPNMPADSHALVALDGLHKLVVGAAALTHSRRTGPLSGPGAMIHVIEPCRRRGIAKALCDGLLQVAASQQAQAIYAAQRVEVGSPEIEAWQRLGFSVFETVEEHELPLDQFVPRLAPLVERFRRQSRLPADAKIVPLYAADRQQVLELHLNEMGGDRESLSRRLRGEGPHPFHPRYSRVLMVGDRTVGCILNYLKSRHVAAVEANIVAPEYRGGWANIWLKLEATQGALRLGITHFHFTSFDHYDDTRRFTSKLGGVVTRCFALMHRPLM